MVAKRLMLGQLASVGESAVGKLAQSQVGHKALESALQLKERVEKMMGGLESLEQRMAAAEQRLDALEKPARATSAAGEKKTTAKKTTPRKSTARKSAS